MKRHFFFYYYYFYVDSSVLLYLFRSYFGEGAWLGVRMERKIKYNIYIFIPSFYKMYSTRKAGCKFSFEENERSCFGSLLYLFLRKYMHFLFHLVFLSFFVFQILSLENLFTVWYKKNCIFHVPLKETNLKI